MMRLRGITVGRLPNLSGVLARVNSTEAAAVAQDVPKGWETAKPYEDIPGPKPLPIIGNLWRFLPGGEFANIDVAVLNRKLLRDYGKIAKFGGIPGRNDMVLLYDPEDVSLVYRNEGIWPIREGTPSMTYYRGVTRKDFFHGAEGLLASQGQEWGKFRSTVNQPMMQPRIAQMYVGPIDEVADDFMKKIAVLRDPVTGELPADFINELYKWALESISMVALDTRLGCLEHNMAVDSEAQKMVDSVQSILDCLFKLDMKMQIWKYVSTPTWRRFVKSLDYYTGVCMKYINQAMERFKTLPPDHEPSVLERILARDPNPKVAATMAIDMMMAGVDSTSNSVGFLLYYLAINPEAQKKLHDEIDAVLPKDSKEPITVDNLNDLKYLKACLKESMRLSPIAMANMRKSNKDMVLMGYRIPKNTDIVFCHMTMSNQEEHFKQPERFMPERWLKEDPDSTTSHKQTHPFVFMPFGFGTRSCIGRRFAELEIEVLVAKIMRQYVVEWHHPPMETESKLLQSCKSPLRFTLIVRK